MSLPAANHKDPQLFDFGVFPRPRYDALKTQAYLLTLKDPEWIPNSTSYFTLEEENLAVILEIQVGKTLWALAKTKPEYAWVYFEGVDHTFENLEGRPDEPDRRSDSEIYLYLMMVETQLCHYIDGVMSQRIRLRFKYMIAGGIETYTEFFDEYRPSEQNWRACLDVAEFIKKTDDYTIATKFLVEYLQTKPWFVFYTSLFKLGFQPREVYMVMEEEEENTSKDKEEYIPKESWGTRHYQNARAKFLQWARDADIEVPDPLVRRRGNRAKHNQANKERPDIKCYYCKKRGHFKSECPDRKKPRDKNASNTRSGNDWEVPFLFSTGSTVNVVNDIRYFQAFHCQRVQCWSLGTEAYAEGYGTVIIEMGDRRMRLEKVYYMPKLPVSIYAPQPDLYNMSWESLLDRTWIENGAANIVLKVLSPGEQGTVFYDNEEDALSAPFGKEGITKKLKYFRKLENMEKPKSGTFIMQVNGPKEDEESKASQLKKQRMDYHTQFGHPDEDQWAAIRKIEGIPELMTHVTLEECASCAKIKGYHAVKK